MREFPFNAARLILLSTAICIGLKSGSVRAANESWLHQSLSTAADAVAARRSVGLDPALKRRIVSEGDIMMSAFCAGPVQANKCERILTTPLVEAEVDRYVAQLLSTPQEVRIIAANLAKAVGTDLGMAGWPSDVANDVGVVTLPEGARIGTVMLSGASGRTEIGRALTSLLMLPGTYRITVQDSPSEAQSGTTEVKAQTAVRLALNKSRVDDAPFGRLDPPNESFCFDSGEVRFEGPVGMFNWGRATYQEPVATKQANLASTATIPAVFVRLDDPAQVCDGPCKRAVGVAFAEALATWKAGCERCDQNAMSVLSVSGATWIDSRIAHRLRLRTTTAFLNLNQALPNENVRIVPPSIVPTRTAVYGYEQLTGNAALKRAVCELPDDRTVPWLPALRAAVCGESSGGVPRITPVLRFTAGSTSCGPSKDFIACGLPNNGIEISVELDRFELTGNGFTIQFGVSNDSPPIKLRTVILHEVGHWFGVPHFESTGLSGADIMGEVYGKGKACVSGVSLMMLNNAADLRWRYRVSEGKGLRRPYSRQSSSGSR